MSRAPPSAKTTAVKRKLAVASTRKQVGARPKKVKHAAAVAMARQTALNEVPELSPTAHTDVGVDNGVDERCSRGHYGCGRWTDDGIDHERTNEDDSMTADLEDELMKYGGEFERTGPPAVGGPDAGGGGLSAPVALSTLIPPSRPGNMHLHSPGPMLRDLTTTAALLISPPPPVVACGSGAGGTAGGGQTDACRPPGHASAAAATAIVQSPADGAKWFSWSPAAAGHWSDRSPLGGGSSVGNLMLLHAVQRTEQPRVRRSSVATPFNNDGGSDGGLFLVAGNTDGRDGGGTGGSLARRSDDDQHLSCTIVPAAGASGGRHLLSVL